MNLRRVDAYYRRPLPRAGWYPAPNGAVELWFWTGHEWRTPEDMVEEMMSDKLRPHFERIFIRGVQYGISMGQQMAAKQQEA